MNAKLNLTANGKRWTDAQDKQLARMYIEQGMSHKDMGEILGRTEWAVGARITALGLFKDKRVYRKQQEEKTLQGLSTRNVIARTELESLRNRLTGYKYATAALAFVAVASLAYSV